MMYPRLFLARNLLREDGMIMISIDDNEIKTLRAIMDEIFGEENFVDTIIWKKRYGGGAKEKHLVTLHEYILVYARSIEQIRDIFVPLTQESIDRYYKNKDENYEKRGPFRTHPLESMKSFEERENLRFPIHAPDGKSVMPKRQWRWSQEHVEQAAKAGELHFSKDKEGNWSISSKQYLRDEKGQRETKFFSVIDDVFTQHGTNEIVDIFGDAQVFSFPKPSKLISKILQFSTSPNGDDLVLDFFAGSGTTGHAVLESNRNDGGNRKFILVQLPEPTEQKAYPTIADIGKERIRRVIGKIKEEQEQKKDLFADDKPKLDLGFKVFKLEPSNFKLWNDQVDKDKDAIKNQLEMFVEHINPLSSQEDILYELLLKSGFSLSTKIEQLSFADKAVFSIDEGAMLICLEKDLTPEVIKAMADKKPVRVICLDEGFHGNDQLKTNAAQIMKSKDIAFRTV